MLVTPEIERRTPRFSLAQAQGYAAAAGGRIPLTLHVGVREGHRGAYSHGRFFAHGEHSLEVTAEELHELEKDRCAMLPFFFNLPGNHPMKGEAQGAQTHSLSEAHLAASHVGALSADEAAAVAAIRRLGADGSKTSSADVVALLSAGVPLERLLGAVRESPETLSRFLEGGEHQTPAVDSRGTQDTHGKALGVDSLGSVARTSEQLSDAELEQATAPGRPTDANTSGAAQRRNLGTRKGG